MSLREAAKKALHCLETSRVFVTSRERIKRPEGEDFYDEAIKALRKTLAEDEAPKAEPAESAEAELSDEEIERIWFDTLNAMPRGSTNSEIRRTCVRAVLAHGRKG